MSVNAISNMISKLLFVVLFSLPLAANAAIDTYEFKDDATRERFQVLAAELRCPKCQNQNIADSNSPIAEDLRTELHRMLQSDATNDEIIDFMVTRYGEFVLYRPRLNEHTYLLWFGPAALLVLGIIVVLVVSRKKKDKTDSAGSGLSADEQQRLNDLLKQDKDK